MAQEAKLMRREKHARLIMDALPATKWELCERYGWSMGQLEYALGFIKDALQVARRQPICYDEQWRLKVAATWEELQPYLMRFRFRSIATQTRRAACGLQAAFLAAEDDPGFADEQTARDIAVLLRDARRLQEDAELLTG